MMTANCILPPILKCPSYFKNQFLYQRPHALDHDDEIIAFTVHEMDISLAEISTVKDETDMFVAVSFRFLQHKLEL